MKNLVAFFVLVAIFLCVPTSIVLAAGSCNSTCQVDEDCQRGYSCYVGICRNTQCASSPSCLCTVSPIQSSAPASTPNVVQSSEPEQIASPEAIPRHTPKTGFSIVGLLSIALSMFGLGIGLSLQQTIPSAQDIGYQSMRMRTQKKEEFSLRDR